MERLKGKKQIEKLFVSGRSVGVFPLRLVFLKTEETNKVGVSVSKKNFKSAVNRNKIKRLLRIAVENHFLDLFKVGTQILYDGFICGERNSKSRRVGYTI